MKLIKSILQMISGRERTARNEIFNERLEHEKALESEVVPQHIKWGARGSV